MTKQDYVSPYLQRPLRTLAEACEDISRQRGLPMPDCTNCVFRNDRLCDHPLKNVARTTRRRRRTGETGPKLPQAA